MALKAAVTTRTNFSHTRNRGESLYEGVIEIVGEVMGASVEGTIKVGVPFAFGYKDESTAIAVATAVAKNLGFSLVGSTTEEGAGE